MRESFGTAFVVQAVIIFVAIFIFFFVAGMSYTKGFKVKNRIVDIIEKNGCFNEGSCQSQDEIAEILKQSGYRLNTKANNCSEAAPRLTEGVADQSELVYDGTNDYGYCVYKVHVNGRGDYYRVASFIYFDFPLNLGTIEFPVYGETKVLTEY